ncbi:hypothetical protein DYB37_013132 [Aphanomyces astaci]|uniref:Uncharacterized protein n=1 Tax=Aphanomyces astaci TaxID=112090 RepID=A0A418EBR2_APHAT|nr:hypothetical protein DYB35_013552 [Aphanomyces astaci]RHZ10545.1 hypothetical protein DYB37_013132 [Aphanomyces astaci]
MAVKLTLKESIVQSKSDVKTIRTLRDPVRNNVGALDVTGSRWLNNSNSSSCSSISYPTKNPPSTMASSLKRRRTGDTKSLEALSLTLKMKCLIVEAHMTNMNMDVLERNLESIANELALLYVFGIQDESSCVRFMHSAYDRVNKLMAMKNVDSERRTLSSSPDALWTASKSRALSVHDADVNMTACYEITLDDIATFWKQIQLAKAKATTLWNAENLHDAMPYMRAADTYFKRLHLKCQKLNLDYAMIGARCIVPMAKKAKRVSFADKVEFVGTAQADFDRSPISPTKPTPLEALLLRASREFPMPSF